MKLPVVSCQLPVASRQGDKRPRVDALLATGHCRLTTRRAFTLTELLIVIGLIALMLTLTIPAFRFITGSRQTDAAYNVVSAVLGQTRAEAIGLQETRGVFFYRKDSRIFAAPIRVTPQIAQDLIAPMNGEVLVFDLIEDHEAISFPNKVGIQMVNNALFTTRAGSQKSFDRYLGFNDTPTLAVQYGGVILFDGNGQLLCENYAFRCVNRNAAGTPTTYTPMGQLLFGKVAADVPPASEDDFLPVAKVIGGNENPYCLRSQIGFVLFDEVIAEGAVGMAEKNQDVQINNGDIAASTDERARETWLDTNASPWVVNRFNGTLVKGE